MNKITTPEVLDAFIKDVKNLAQSYGLEAQLDHSTAYTNADLVEMKLQVANIPSDCKDIQEYLYVLHSEKFGLRRSDYGKEIMCDGRRYIIIGATQRRNKYPIMTYCIDTDKTMLLTLNAVLNGLGR